MPLSLFFLGPPRLERDGDLRDTDTRKAIALLAYLAVGGEVHSREALAALLWPEMDERRARAALRRTLSAAKTAVGDAALHATRDAIGLEPDAAWCDVTAFRAALTAVSTHPHPANALCADCAARLETAVALYRGDFLAGFSLRDSLPFDDWQLQQAEALRREMTQALAQLVPHTAAAGRPQAAIDHAHRWLQLDPLREEAHRHLMRLYAHTGRRAAALQQYRDCVRTLDAELGVPPLPETTALYEAIQGEGVMGWQGEGVMGWQGDGVKQITSTPPHPHTPSPPHPHTPTPPHPVGRDAELAALAAAYAAVGPDGRFLALTGEAGIGKTYLAEAFLAARPDAPLLRARCYEGETALAYAPFVQALRDRLQQPDAAARVAAVEPTWLAEAARLLPELHALAPDLPAPPPLDWPGGPGRFLESLARLLAALLTPAAPDDPIRLSAPPSAAAAGVLWLDDAQWADGASLDLLAFLAHRWRQRPFLLLLCWREGDLAADHRLHRLLADARRAGVGAQLALPRLQPAAVARLAADAGAAAPGLPERLFRETEGLPFLVTAYLENRPRPGEPWVLPPTARDLFQARLARAGETGRQLLQAAAVIGTAFDFDLLQAAGGRSEAEALAALEELLAQRLLAELPGEPPFDFSHHKLRELIVDEMSLVRRRLLHRRVAQALRARPGAPPARLAFHYQHAGQEAEAADWYARAGAAARSLFAHREALAHYQAALALGHPETAALHEACGDLHTRLGAYSAALASYEAAASAAAQPQLPRIEHKLGQVQYRRGSWQQAEHHFAQAEAAWRAAEAGPALARLLIDWSYTAHRAGDLPRAQALAERAQALAAPDGEAPDGEAPDGEAPGELQVRLDNIRGILARAAGDLDAALVHFRRGSQLAAAHGFVSGQIAALNNLALAETAVGQADAAQALLETALRRCLAYGDRHWEAALRNNLADLLHARGEKEAAMAQLKTAVTILAEMGQEAGQWQPEIWKLTEW